MPRDSHAHRNSILVIDVGNTTVHLAVFAGEAIVEERKMATKKMDARPVHDLLEKSDALVVSSVVPSTVPHFQQLSAQLKKRLLVVDHTLDLGIELACDESAQIGADRLCNAVAACEKYETPTIVIDFGTAITFDVLTDGNRYVGGHILPGASLQAQVLHESTAKLPLIDVVPPKRVIGANTEDAMSAGIFFGIAGAVGAIHSIIAREVGEGTVVLTGGGMGLFAPHLKIASVSDPHLTLDGARLIYERNKD